eukprot:gene5346-biopygen5345
MLMYMDDFLMLVSSEVEALGARGLATRVLVGLELAVQMQGAALQDATVGNYRPKAEASMQFCVAEGRSWLLAAEAKVRLYIIYLMSTGTIKAASSQPYLSAINNHHEDMVVTFGRPDTGVSMLKEHISVSGELVSAALHEGDSKRHVRLKRVQGMVQLLQHWEQAWDDLWLQGGSAEDSARHSS